MNCPLRYQNRILFLVKNFCWEQSFLPSEIVTISQRKHWPKFGDALGQFCENCHRNLFLARKCLHSILCIVFKFSKIMFLLMLNDHYFAVFFMFSCVTNDTVQPTYISHIILLLKTPVACLFNFKTFMEQHKFVHKNVGCRLHKLLFVVRFCFLCEDNFWSVLN